MFLKNVFGLLVILWIRFHQGLIAAVTAVTDLDPDCQSNWDHWTSYEQGIVKWKIANADCVSSLRPGSSTWPSLPRNLQVSLVKKQGMSPACGLNISWSLPDDHSREVLTGFLIQIQRWNEFDTRALFPNNRCYKVMMDARSWPQDESTVLRLMNIVFSHACLKNASGSFTSYQVDVYNLPAKHPKLKPRSVTHHGSFSQCFEAPVKVRTRELTSPPPTASTTEWSSERRVFADWLFMGVMLTVVALALLVLIIVVLMCRSTVCKSQNSPKILQTCCNYRLAKPLLLDSGIASGSIFNQPPPLDTSTVVSEDFFIFSTTEMTPL